MDGSAPHEGKRRVHGSGTVHLALVEAAHRVRVEEEDTAGIIIEADADSLRQRQDTAALVSRSCSVGRFGNEELAHACCEQSEGLRELIARVFTATVMPAVMVIPRKKLWEWHEQDLPSRKWLAWTRSNYLKQQIRCTDLNEQHSF